MAGWLGRPLRVITAPHLGVLNLVGDASAVARSEDLEALRPFFVSVCESDRSVPTCDALFLYATLNPDGSVAGAAEGLRAIIRDSRAKVVVLAWETLMDRAVLATRRAGYGGANIVITLARKGTAFSQFFRELFQAMSEGEGMPDAWIRIAPQDPALVRPHRPNLVFLCESGRIAFGRGRARS